MDSNDVNPVYRRQAPEDGISAGTVLKRVGLTRARLRNWVRLGLVQPVVVGHGTRAWWCYTPEMVSRLRWIKEHIDEGYTLRGAFAKAMKFEDFERQRKELARALASQPVAAAVDVGRASAGDPFGG